MECLISYPTFNFFTSYEEKKAKVFYVEGNVGVGKTECATCVCELLRERGIKAKVIEENVDQWNNYLIDCRSDYGSLVFAAYAALQGHMTRENSAKGDDAAELDVILIERHPTTTLEVFDESEPVQKLYESVNAMTGFLSNPAHTIYLKNSAQACYERSKRRGRASEKSLELFAFETWNYKHDEMMKKREALGGQVYTFDAFGANAHHLTSSIVKCLGY
jgi:thymidylate kinase